MGLTGAAPVAANRETAPRFRRARGADAASVLVVFVILLIGIPTDLVLKALGANATPAMLLGPILLLWWVCARVLPGSGVARGRNPVRIAIGLLSVSVLAAYAAGSLGHVAGVEQRGADRGILYFVALAGTALLAMDGITTRARLDRVLKALVVMSTFSAVLAMLTFFFGWYPINTIHIPGLTAVGDITYIGTRSGLRRVSGTARHPLEFGMLMALVLPIALHYAFWTPKPRNRKWWICTGIIVFALPMAVSRAAIIGVIVAGVLLFVTWPKSRQRRTLLTAPFYLAATHIVAPRLLSTLGSLFQTESTDPSIQHRTHNYARVGSVMRHHWLFGNGGFGSYAPIRVDFVLDNAYLGYLFESGVFGVACLLLLLFVCILAARGARRRSSDPSDRDLAQSLAASVAVVVPALFTFDTFGYPGATGAVFLVLGCCGALWRLSRQEQLEAARATMQLAQLGADTELETSGVE
jgi:O-antigen ligase